MVEGHGYFERGLEVGQGEAVVVGYCLGELPACSAVMISLTRKQQALELHFVGRMGSLLSLRYHAISAYSIQSIHIP